MKKALLYLMIFCMGLVPNALKAQTTITIGYGTTSHYSTPVNMYWEYSLTQQIYTAEEIGMEGGGTIHSISFHYAYTGSFTLDHIQVYMLNTDKSTFDNDTDMVPMTAHDLVYDGALTATGNGWLTLTLQQPFVYDGRNLLVCFYDPSDSISYPGDIYRFYTTQTSGSYRTLSYYSDDVVPDVANPANHDNDDQLVRSRYQNRANIRLNITPASQSVSIGNGTGVISSTPFISGYGYSFMEQIYTAEEIAQPAGGTIQTVSFKMQSSTTQTNHITLYMKNVSRSTFSSATDYETVTASDVVYDGDWELSEGWNTITLTVPFEYDGTSNLMVAMHENTSGYSYRYFYYTFKSNSTICQYSNTQDPDPYNLSSWAGSSGRASYRANIQLGIIPNESNNDAVAIGDGTILSNFSPYFTYYNYSFTEQLYTAAEVGKPAGGTVKSISFNMDSDDPQTNHVTVYLKNTTKSKFFYTSDYEAVTANDVVFDGMYTFQHGQNTILLDVPFEYDGISNLMVAMHENTPDYDPRNFYSTIKDSSVLVYYSDSYDPDPNNLSSYSGFKDIGPSRSNISIEFFPSEGIGQATTSYNSLPVNMWYNYSLTQQIYTAEEIGVTNGGTINALSFHYAYTNSFSLNNIKVYLVNTSKSSFSSSTDMVSVTAADNVYAGTFSATGRGWVTITLDTPFQYTGGNLVVCMLDTTNGYPGVIISSTALARGHHVKPLVTIATVTSPASTV